MTAFLKFTQLTVGWVTPGWDFRGIYNAIEADNGIIAVAQGINRQLSHAPKTISRLNQPHSHRKCSNPGFPGGIHWSHSSSTSFLTGAGGKTEHSISVVVQQLPSKREYSLPLTPYLCFCEHSQGCCLPTLLSVESTVHCGFMLSLQSYWTPRPLVTELLPRKSVPRLLCYLEYVCGGLEDYFSNLLELAWLGILWTWCNILQNTQRKFSLL